MLKATLVFLCAIITLVPGANSSVAVGQERERSSDPLALSREAIGGAGKLSAVRSLRLEGTSETVNQFFGQSPSAKRQFLTHKLTVEAIPPSHYRAVRQRLDMPVWRQTGFADDKLLNALRMPDGREEQSWKGPDALRSARAEFGRLMVLLLLRTDVLRQVNLEGKEDGSVVITAEHDFKARLRLDRETHVPNSLEFTVSIVGSGETRNYVTMATDRVDVDGVSIPRSMTTTVDGKVFEKIYFERVDLQARLEIAGFGGRDE